MLDPFVGVGSTLKACALEGRQGIGIELNPTFVELARDRIHTEVRDLFSTSEEQNVLEGDARDRLPDIAEESIDFIVTSPPYWAILKKEDHKVRQERIANGLPTDYGEDPRDLGQIGDYEDFLAELTAIFSECQRVLKRGKFMAVVVSDFRDKSRYVMFHSDLAQALETIGLEMKGLKVLHQRHQKSLSLRLPLLLRAEHPPSIHPDPSETQGGKMNQQIVRGDCIEGMKGLGDRKFNLIIADPPYNLDKDFGVWKEREKRAEWKDWTREWLYEALQVLSDQGNIFVYGIHQHQCWVQCIMYELGFVYRRQIIWHYENGFAGYGERSLSASYESLLWFSKTQDYIYHPIPRALQKPRALEVQDHQERQGLDPEPRRQIGRGRVVLPNTGRPAFPR